MQCENALKICQNDSKPHALDFFLKCVTFVEKLSDLKLHCKKPSKNFRCAHLTFL